MLTSLAEDDLEEIGYGLGVEALVERRIRQAIDAGVDGVVGSPHEAALARRIGGPDFLVVTPGVRPGLGQAPTTRPAPRPRPRPWRRAPATSSAAARSPPPPIPAPRPSRSSRR